MNKLMEILHSKRKDKKGFTLMEMLIVVAIIAILVAIAVPTFNASLNTAKEATDKANMRTAEVVASAMQANHLYDNSIDDIKANDWFDVATGTFSATVPEPYGKASDHTTQAIKCEKIDADTGDITLKWAATTAP